MRVDITLEKGAPGNIAVTVKHVDGDTPAEVYQCRALRLSLLRDYFSATAGCEALAEALTHLLTKSSANDHANFHGDAAYISALLLEELREIAAARQELDRRVRVLLTDRSETNLLAMDHATEAAKVCRDIRSRLSADGLPYSLVGNGNSMTTRPTTASSALPPTSNGGCCV